MNTFGLIFMTLVLLFYSVFGIYCLSHGLWGIWKDRQEAKRRTLEQENRTVRPKRSSIFPDEPKGKGVQPPTEKRDGQPAEKKDGGQPQRVEPAQAGEDDAHLPPEYRKQPPGAGGAV